MASSVATIVRIAKEQARRAESEEAIFARMGLIGNDAALARATFARRTLAFDKKEMVSRGRRLFNKFKGALKQAVCDDFHYCSKRGAVDRGLNQYLPEIVKLLTKRIPISGKVPTWLASVLRVFGITASSLDVVVALLMAWLIVQGCNALCNCPA